MTRESPSATTIPQLLIDRAAAHPERIALRVLGDGERVTTELSYQALWERAAAVAERIAERAPRGARAVILHDNDEHYALAFYGCLIAGVIAVPAFPPEPNRKQPMERLRGIVRDAQPALLLTSSGLAPAVTAALAELAPGAPVAVLATDGAGERAAGAIAIAGAGEDVAFLQYTSGSTGSPRGVMVSHGNILANERAIAAAFGNSSDDVVVSWLPLYHDMGLIGGLLQPLYLGGQLVLLTPEQFGVSPARWLKAIARFGGTCSGAPDFAYRMCLDRLKPYQLEGLSLESWQVAFCGAEPIRAETLTAFADKLAPYGFSPRALYPCYGLAEATLLVSGGARRGGAVLQRFDAEAYAEGRAVADEGGRLLVGCGAAQAEHQVTVVDPERGAPVAAGQIGEIVVEGPSVTAGYWQSPAATAALFLAGKPGALRTGDLGFLHDGQLYITGRRKDLLIIRGQNVYPQDIEQTVGEEVEVVRAGRVAAFAVEGEAGEGIGVAVEIGRRTQKLVQAEAVFAAIAEAVTEAHGDPPALILLLDQGSLPMTSSGKLRRGACLPAWRDGSLVPYAVWQRGQETTAAATAPEAASADADSPTMQRLAQLARETLGAPIVRSSDSFFAAGGSSLTGLQLAARIGDEWGIALDARSLFGAPTFGALARHLDELRAAQMRGATPGAAAGAAPGVTPGAAAGAAPRLTAGAREGALPLSFGEQRLWFLHQLEPASTAYHLAGTLRLTGPLDPAALARACSAVIARHEALRTRFVTEGGEGGAAGAAGAASDGGGKPVRALDAAWQMELPVLELRDAAALRRLIDEEAARPFDLARDRLWRARLVQTGEREHVLVSVLHHIVADGWSMDVLRRELAQRYREIVDGELDAEASALPALPLQVADFALWQRRWQDSDERARQAAYWRQQLAGERAPLGLPRTAANRTAGARRDLTSTFALDAALTQRLRALAQAHGTTLYAVLLGGLQVVLARYAGQDDLWIGAPIANRRPEVGGLIGFFVNTAVLRTRVERRAGFAAHLARVQETLAGALAHSDLPFQHVLEATGAERELDQQALFQVFYNHLAPEYTAPLAAGALTWGPIERHSYAADFDLVLDTAEVGRDAERSVAATFTYRSNRIDEGAVERLAMQYAALLAAVAADAQTPVGLLPMLDERHAARAFSWPASHTEELVPAAIARHAALRPSAIAVRFGDAELSYGELSRRADRLAGQLAARLAALPPRGDGSEPIVGVCAEPSFELVLGLLAALKAGAAFLTLDPSYPMDRLEHMLRDAHPDVVLVAEPLRAIVAGAIADAGRALGFDEALAAPALAAPAPALRPQSLAYCIYTSGSTGAPKAALLTHGGLANHLAWLASVLPDGATARVLQCAPSGFDAAVCEFFLPLVGGGTCVLATRDDARDPDRLLALLERQRITTFVTVPSLLELIVEAPRSEEILPQLGCLGSGGEALTARLAERLLALSARSGVALWNLYGPTEITIDATAWRLSSSDRGGDAPIGHPIANATAHVLDGMLREVPAGGCGELYIGGAGLARGYLGRPDATAERFLPDPFRADGARLYRTGDRVRRRADGALEYLERVDRQIKLAGHRIELGEITAALAALPEVRQATVEVREDFGKRQLVAYVALHAAAAAATSHAELRDSLPARLAKRLPAPMVPRVYVFLDALPVMPSGKLDRAALPAPDLSAAQREYVAPRSSAERTLAAIWREVLSGGDRAMQVGVHDNFFLLGGDSIVAIQVVGRARAAGLPISPREIFQHQTIAALAAAAEQLGAEGGAAGQALAAARLRQLPPGRFPLARLSEAQLAQLPVPLEDVEDIFPLTPMQEGMLLHTLLEPGSGIYLMQDRYRVDSELFPEPFLAAWDAVIARHSALRASFWQLDDKALQIIHRQIPRCTEYVDLRGLPAAEQDRRIDELLAEERRRGFDFAAAPLVKLRLFQLAERSFVYVESHHHILMDDWCRSLLFLDFFAAYAALLGGERPVLGPAPRHGDHVAWLELQLPEERERALAYWQATLAGVEAATPLSIDRPISAADGPSRVGYQSLELTAAQTEQLAQTARRLRLTANTLAQGAWAALLSRYAGSRDVVFGVTVSGRHAEIPGVQEMVGLFVNSIPLRVALPSPGDRTSVAEWLRALQDQNLQHRRYEHVPLVEIQARTAVPRGDELFHSLFVFENAPLDPSLKLRAAELRFRLQENRTHTNYPITAVAIPGERLKLVLSYDERRFAHDDIERMLGHFARLLRSMAERPEQPAGALSLLSSSEIRTMVHAWNATSRDHQLVATAARPHRGFADRFAERAAAAPGAVALRCRGEELRYGELARRAHRVAWALGARGVAPGDFVGVHAERGLDQITLIAGVLAAGAVYVPLDVKHPAERVLQIARASGARLIATTGAVALPPELAERSASMAALLAEAGREDAPNLPCHPEQLAYVIYTSGSTGTPKGAMVTLAGMLNNQLSKVPFFGLSDRDVIAQTAAPSFDISVWQMLTGLLSGSVIDIVPDDVIGDPRALLAHVRARGITLLESVPSLIAELLHESGPAPDGAGDGADDGTGAGAGADGRAADLPLRFLLPTGEALPPELARQWLRRYPRVPLVNAYGPAECADDVALHRVDEPPAADVVRMPIGTPTDNTRLFVLDRDLALVPVGVVGQLACAGIGVGHGYLADPARTAAVFVPHPYGEPGERLYLTGDLARWRADGVLEYVGRADQQIKLRGHRIELGEIEARLLEQPGIEQAAVILRQDVPGQPRLVGYVVRSGGPSGAPDEAAEPPLDGVRARLAAALPAAMVPAKLCALAALPRSPNGKIDRRALAALPAPETGSDGGAGYVAPRTPLEAQLARIWADALGLAQVGIDDNFFDLGGHSLLITRVAARIRNELGFDLPLRALFDGQTVAAVAELIERGRPRATGADIAAMSDLLDELEQM